MKILDPRHDFIQSVREADLARVMQLIAEDDSLVNAQVRGDITLTGKTWTDDGQVDVGQDSSEHAGALHFAAFNGLNELAQLLIDQGADLHAQAEFGQKKGVTAVTLAAWQGNAETLSVMLRALCDSALAANESRADQLQPALFSSLAHSSQDKVDLLIEHGAEYDIFTAAMAGDGVALRRLIAAAPDSVNRKHPEYDRTPLEQALTVGQMEMADLLVENGAEVTPISAAGMGLLDQLKTLFSEDKNAVTRWYGSYPLLIWAILGEQVDVVNFLLNQGADPNGGDRWGDTPLGHVANVKGKPGEQMVNVLVAAGADIHQQSRGDTPIERATKQGNNHVRLALKKHGSCDRNRHSQ